MTSLALLDCHSPAVVLQSLATYLREPPDVIRDRLVHFDIEAALAADPERAPEDILWSLFPRRQRQWPYQGVCWFNFTRSDSPTFDSAGILPLSATLPTIHERLRLIASRIAPDCKWDGFVREMEQQQLGHSSWLYGLKVGNPSHTGPYALLIREAGLSPSSRCSHYARTPEIIEDICRSFKEYSGHDLLSAFISSSRPYCVKFIDPMESRSCIFAALGYAYRSARGEALAMADCHAFSGNGSFISPDRIISVEPLDI
jgi:hypothetical protein